MYVVCLLFYAIGRFLFGLILFMIGQDWLIDCSGFNVLERGRYLSNFACLQLRLKEGEDISGTLVIKCGIILQQALVCI